MVTSEHVIKSNSLSSERSEEPRECVCVCARTLDSSRVGSS